MPGLSEILLDAIEAEVFAREKGEPNSKMSVVMAKNKEGIAPCCWGLELRLLH
jgi:hypothetical protein